MRLRRCIEGLYLLGAALAFPAFATPNHTYETVSICSVLKNPSAYANKKVSFRGSVYVGMENTNISDGACPGHAIELYVGDDVYEHLDIRDFHRKITHWKMHGFATVAGTFTISDSPLTPYVLHLEKVWHVSVEAATKAH